MQHMIRKLHPAFLLTSATKVVCNQGACLSALLALQHVTYNESVLPHLRSYNNTVLFCTVLAGVQLLFPAPPHFSEVFSTHRTLGRRGEDFHFTATHVLLVFKNSTN